MIEFTLQPSNKKAKYIFEKNIDVLNLITIHELIYIKSLNCAIITNNANYSILSTNIFIDVDDYSKTWRCVLSDNRNKVSSYNSDSISKYNPRSLS